MKTVAVVLWEWSVLWISKRFRRMILLFLAFQMLLTFDAYSAFVDLLLYEWIHWIHFMLARFFMLLYLVIFAYLVVRSYWALIQCCLFQDGVVDLLQRIPYRFLCQVEPKIVHWVYWLFALFKPNVLKGLLNFFPHVMEVLMFQHDINQPPLKEKFTHPSLYFVK